MTKLLITGYSGFVGGHLLNLLSDYYDIKLFGRSNPAFCFEYFRGSINNDTDYTNALDGIDVVVHLAALTSTTNNKSQSHIDLFKEINMKGTLNLAAQALKCGVKRFIYVSSIKVNGENTPINFPFTSLDSHKPENAYALSKSEAEQNLISLLKKSPMEYVIIRPPLVYGEGVKGNFSAMMNLVRKNVPLPFGSISSNKRSLVSVYNLVDLIKICIEHPKAINQIFLVSDNDDLSTAGMVKLMADVQGVTPLLLPIPVWLLKLIGKLSFKTSMFSRLTDSLCVDITHTQETLDWSPPFTIRESFLKCVEKKDV